MKEVYAVQKRDGSFREFPSKRAARIFSGNLPALALQYKKGVWMTTDRVLWEWVA